MNSTGGGGGDLSASFHAGISITPDTVNYPQYIVYASLLSIFFIIMKE